MGDEVETSMTTAEQLASIDDMRNELAEARRYVRTNPKETVDAIVRFRGKLYLARGWDDTIDRCLYRWTTNLSVGLDWMASGPYALEGYLDGTSFELLLVRGQVEKHGRKADNP